MRCFYSEAIAVEALVIVLPLDRYATKVHMEIQAAASPDCAAAGNIAMVSLIVNVHAPNIGEAFATADGDSTGSVQAD